MFLGDGRNPFELSLHTISAVNFGANDQTCASCTKFSPRTCAHI